MAHHIPLELFPVIFEFILNPQHLSTLCLVNKTFNRFATPLLYHRVFIFAWYKDAKSKVVQLFRTLSSYPHLARYVEKLEIRDFPKGFSADRHAELRQLCAQGVRNCINLRSCTWTRDGSLHSVMLESLGGCSQLHELEINGNDSEYDPTLLKRFSRLSKISLIMPSTRVLDILPAWVSITGKTLRGLTIVCKASTQVTDALLVHLASDLQDLEHLSIVGCPKVTHLGVGMIASTNKDGLLGISIEGLSQSFDMSAFKATCLRSEAFRRLRAITLTIYIHMPLAEWMCDVEDLLSSAPLELFSIYSMSTSIRIPDEFWKNLVARHGRRLKKFSVHRMLIGLATLEAICSQCSVLEQLFIQADQWDLDNAAHLFGLAKNLHTLHINFSLATSDSSMMYPSMLMQRAMSIVSVCSPTLAHIGCNTRAWQVKKVVHEDEKGAKYIVPTLAPQENPAIPEQFLVIRA